MGKISTEISVIYPILHFTGSTEDESVECFLHSVSNLMLMDISYDMIILEQEFRCRIIQATGIDNTLASSHNLCAFNMISFFLRRHFLVPLRKELGE